MITHANLCSQVEALYTVPLDANCRLASILPLSHLFELTVGLLYPLSRGAAIHYVPSRRGPDILRVLKEQRITHIIAVPQLLTLMGTALDERVRGLLPGPIYRAVHGLAPTLPTPLRRALFWPVHRPLGGHLRMMASGGAALPPDTQRLWERMGVRVLEGYGTSECSPVVACGVGDGSTPVGSVGRPLRGVEVRLSDEQELLVRGPNVMKGYWKDPERTAEVLRENWYATGDMASIDERGNIRILGRVKDLIVLPSGLKVWPQDVEDVFREHHRVKDAAVLAVPGAAGGATLHAYLIPKGAESTDAHPHPGPLPQGRGHEAGDGQPPSASPDEAGKPAPSGAEGMPMLPGNGLERIVAECNGRLAVHQRVATASWWVEADFPRTTTLKVKRSLLPLPGAGEVVEIEAALAADDPVGQAVAGVARVAAVQSKQNLAELGLDSLGLVELAIALEEKTGKLVVEEDLRLDMTVEEVRTLVLTSGREGAVPDETDGRSGLQREGGPRAWSAEPPLWPYTWGRIFRHLAFPVDLIYRWAATRTSVIGTEHLAPLDGAEGPQPLRVIFAGTHHGWPDLPLLRDGLRRSTVRRLAARVVSAAGAGGWSGAGLWAWYGVLAFGLYPLRQYREREANLRRLLQVADAGNPILIFPQGVHARPEQERAGDPQIRFRTGVAHLALALGAGVLPFGVAGTERLMPPHLDGYKGPVIAGGIPLAITRGPLAIAFGPAMRPQAGETPEEFTDRLQEVCYALTRQAEAALEM